MARLASRASDPARVKVLGCVAFWTVAVCIPNFLTTSAGSVRAAAAVLCCGAWAPELLRPLGIGVGMVATREQIAYVAPAGTGGRDGRDGRGELPVFIEWDEPSYYGLPTPALIVWGDKDRTLNVGGAGVLHKLLPRSQVVIMGGVGHLPMIERPQQSAADYLQFRAGL